MRTGALACRSGSDRGRGHDAAAPPPPAVATTAIAAALAVYAGLLLGLDGAALITACNVATVLATAAAAVAALAAAARPGALRARLSWLLVGLGLASWCFGDVAWALYELAHEHGPPTPSWPTSGTCCTSRWPSPACCCGRSGRCARFRRDVLFLDAAVALSALATICWVLVLGPLFSDLDTDPAVQAVPFAYPLGDLAILFCVVVVALRQVRATLASGLLILGLAAIAVADAAYLVLVAEDGYRTGTRLTCSGSAGWPHSRSRRRTTARRPRPRRRPRTSAIPGVSSCPGCLSPGPGSSPSVRRSSLRGAGPRRARRRSASPCYWSCSAASTAIAIRPWLSVPRRSGTTGRGGRGPRPADRGGEPARVRGSARTAAGRRLHRRPLVRSYPGGRRPLQGVQRRPRPAAGDDALRSLAATIARQADADDLVARIGGDEFALLLDDVRAEDVAGIVRRLQRAIDATCAIRASVGGRCWTPRSAAPATCSRWPTTSSTSRSARGMPLSAPATCRAARLTSAGAEPSYEPCCQVWRKRSRSSRLKRKPPRLPSFAVGMTPSRARRRIVHARRTLLRPGL